MPEIVLKNVTKRWGKFYAVDHLNLHIDDNSFITLLGPSGCGKTTILRMIAGLETPTEGQITIGDRVVFDSAAGINVPANKRKVGFLFQNYALWPNMTVYQNISFGLSNIKEELPRYDFEAMKAGELKKALQSGKRIRDLVEECRDKRGKLDEDKIYLKFMDSFTLSIYTAKELYGLKIHEAADPDAAASEKAEETQGEIYVKISKIEPNRSQPRKNFDEEQLQQLADSMKRYGVLQPLLVQKRENGFEIIAGERRWRAAKMADLKEVPVVVREYDPQQTMESALIENVQREDLNPIEEAMAYQQLIQEFNLKQEEIAERVSKSRTTITNSLRLLNLAKEVQQMLVENRLSSGHARALLSLEDPKQQVELAHKIEQNKMSVREVEKAVKLVGKEKKPKKEKPVDEALELVFQDLEERMKTVMGTKVNISRKDKSKGKIEIEYYSESELERIVELIESIR